MQDFLNMGGYAGFVWPSYIIGVGVLVGLYVMTKRSLSASESQLDILQAARREARAKAKAGANAAPENAAEESA